MENGEFNKGVKGITSSLKGIAGAVGLAFSTQKLVEFGKESINLASDLQEVQNVVDTVFKNSAQEINEFADNALEAYGLSELSAKRYASTMGAMLDSMQIDDDVMLEMSKNLTALSGDMASFHDLSGDDAFQKIRAGISGETEPLKQLGINMSVANMEAFALSQGITKSYNSMTQAEQAILRYNYLLSVTANAQGDFIRTQDGWANQTRVLSERFNELKIVVGDLLINVLTPAVKVLNELVSTALAFAQALSSALGLEQTEASASVDSAATSQENLASATEDATEAQKAQNKVLASFDKLNDISKSADSSSTAASSSGGNSIDMGLSSYVSPSSSDFNTSFISEKLEEILAIVGVACLAIGVILAFTGNVPLGLGLIALGAASLAAAAKINDTKLTKDVTSKLDVIMALVSGAVLILGVILAAAGLLPIGIALIAVGAAGLATVVALNWNAMPDKCKNQISVILGYVSGALLVLGIILCLSGAIPLGVALLIAGAAGLVTVVAFNWNTIVTKIKTTCDKIKTVVSKFGNDVKAWFTGLINKGIGTFEGFINKIIGGLNWLIAKLNAFKITIPSWVPEIGGKGLGFNISPIKTVSIPRLATGAVIPARSEFLAVLGDQKHGRNLEAPEGLIRQIVREESSRLTYEDIKSAFYMALLMAKQNGILDFDVNMDGRKVGQMSAKHVGKELNRSGFVFRTVKG